MGAGEEIGTETDPSVLLLHHLGRESWHGIRRRPASLAWRCRLGAQHPAATSSYPHPPTAAPPRLAQLGSARPGPATTLTALVKNSPTELMVFVFQRCTYVLKYKQLFFWVFFLLEHEHA